MASDAFFKFCDAKELLDAPGGGGGGTLPKNILQLTYLTHHTLFFSANFVKFD